MLESDKENIGSPTQQHTFGGCKSICELPEQTNRFTQIPLKGFHQDIPAKIQAIQGYISNMSVFKIM